MTKKQFEWLRENQPIEVRYVVPYNGKEPKDYHWMHPNEMEIRGEYFICSGGYNTWTGRNFVEHHARYRILYKNIRSIRYNRSRRKR